jgi:hypothetical protein
MNTPLSLNEEEQALVAYLLESPRESLVILTEDFHPGSRMVQEAVQQLQRSHRNLEVIEGSFARYERFAHTQDVHGFPAILHFRKGELQTLLLGVVTEKDLESLGLE